jgi:hypothetical protein
VLLDAGAGNDTVTLLNEGDAGGAMLTINGGSGDDTININGGPGWGGVQANGD